MKHTIVAFCIRVIVTLLCAAGLSARAHDAPGHRATLVMREAGHLSLAVECDLLEVLQRTVAPERPATAFLTQAGAMNADAFSAMWSQARRQWESGFALVLADGSRVKPRKWTWPLPTTVQKGLREQLMQQLTADPSTSPKVRHDHEHAHARLEFSADFLLATPQSAAATLQLELTVAPAFVPLRLTTYKPQHHLVDGQSTSISIRF